MMSHYKNYNHEGRLIDNTADLHDIVNPTLHHLEEPSLHINQAPSPPRQKTQSSPKK